MNSAYKDKTWEAEAETEGEGEYEIVDNIITQQQPAFKETRAASISGVPASKYTNIKIISR